MPKNSNYQLVRIYTRYGKTYEEILKTSQSKFELIELKKQHKDTSHDKYFIRPEITVVKNA